MINLLRPTMQLDKIARLLQYINGRVEDRSDDIIPEPQLLYPGVYGNSQMSGKGQHGPRVSHSSHRCAT